MVCPKGSNQFLGVCLPIPVLELTAHVDAPSAFSRQMYFAAAVLIGAASEKLIYLLMDALAASVTDPKEKASIRKTMRDRFTFDVCKITTPPNSGKKQETPSLGHH